MKKKSRDYRGRSACCRAPFRFDASVVGMTCGGLWLRGWNACTKCGLYTISKRGKACESPTWVLSPGGRSVDISTGRIRARFYIETSERLDVVGIMTRIAKLPELERELAALKKGVA